MTQGTFQDTLILVRRLGEKIVHVGLKSRYFAGIRILMWEIILDMEPLRNLFFISDSHVISVKWFPFKPEVSLLLDLSATKCPLC